MEFMSKIAVTFTQGGAWMWVILGLQIVATAIIVERLIRLYFSRKVNQMDLAKSFEADIRKGDLAKVVERAKEHQETFPIARAILAGAQSALQLGGKDEIQGKMDEVLLEENARIERRTPFLAMLANVGTLTGLLGTIVGMIKSFAAVTYANPMEKAALLSSGISEAMNTTAYGLIMAIPTLIMFAVLTNRAGTLSEDLNQGALKIFNWLSYAYDPVQVREGRRQSRESNVSVNANA